MLPSRELRWANRRKRTRLAVAPVFKITKLSSRVHASRLPASSVVEGDCSHFSLPSLRYLDPSIHIEAGVSMEIEGQDGRGAFFAAGRIPPWGLGAG